MSSDNPLCNEATDLPAYIEVQEFVAERAAETQALLARLGSQKEGKRAFQKLHYEYRRRVQSHNPYRIPRRCRAPILRDMETAPPAPSRRPRRDRRRPRVIAEHFARRSVQGGHWLETHLWHAKRMHMNVLWGHKLAVLPTQKSKRKIYRLAQRRSVLYDESYFVCWDLGEDGLKFIEKHCERVDTASGSHFYDVLVYDLDEQLICPAQILETQPHHVYLFAHPAARDECTKLYDLCGIKYMVIESGVSRFRLFGPDSWSVFTQAFRTHAYSPGDACSDSPTQIERVWNMSYGYLQARLINGLSVHLRVSLPEILGPFPRKLRPERKSVETETLEVAKRDHILHTFDFHADSIKAPLEERFRLTQRSTKRVDSKQAAVKILKKRQFLPFMKNAPSTTSASTETATTEVMVIFRYYGNLPEVLLLMPVNRGARNIWTLLVRQGCRAIGLENLRKLSINCGVPLFPQHWLNTESGRYWEQLQMRRRQHTFERKPKGKRVSLKLLSPGYPFGGFGCTHFSRWLMGPRDAQRIGMCIIAARRLEPDYIPSEQLMKTGMLCRIESVTSKIPGETALLVMPPSEVEAMQNGTELTTLMTQRESDDKAVHYVGAVTDGEHDLKAGSGTGFGVIGVNAYLSRMRQEQSVRKMTTVMEKEARALRRNSCIMFKTDRFRHWTEVTFLCRNPGRVFFWVRVTPLMR